MNTVVNNAAQSNAIVTSLVPSHLRDQLINQNTPGNPIKRRNLKTILSNGETDNDVTSEPLADLFLETTVLFAGTYL